MARRDRPSADALAAWRELLRLHRELLDRLDRDLIEGHQLPLAWYDVLVQLHEAATSRSSRTRDLTMGALAERLLISPATCTRVVEKMVAAGLVARRVDDQDARVRHVSITQTGRAMFRRAALTHLAGIERHFGGHLTNDDARLLAERFAAMRSSLQPGHLAG